MTAKFTRAFYPTFMFILLAALPAAALDWPQWLGPRGNNITDEDGFDADLSHWKTLWKAKVGLGYSSVTVAQGRAFTLGHDGKSKETVYCFDAATGQVIWKHAYDAQLMPKMHAGGPNASATILGNKVVTVGKDGQVFCFSTDKGDVLWQANLVDVLGIKLPTWGIASSPVVQNGQVMLSAGRVASLDLATGHVLWVTSETNLPAYTTPVIFTREGQDFVAALDGSGLAIFEAQGGDAVARTPFKSNFDVTATTPLVFENGNRIFISGNINGRLFAFNGHELTVVWNSTEIKNVISDSVVLDGMIYGIDGQMGTPTTRLVCVNTADGKMNWSKEKFGFATEIGIGKNMLLLTEAGELVTVKLSPAGYTEASRLQVIGGKCWTTPVYADGRIYVRNEAGDVVCVGR